MSEHYYDTHAHLDFPEFREDRDDVIRRAVDAGITRILCVGTTLESSRRVIELAERHPEVFAVVGVHPNHAHEETGDIAGELRRMARHPRVVAIGETGLDEFRLGEKAGGAAVEAIRERQREVFRQQLEVAAENGLNCVIHQRDAFRQTLEFMASYRGRVRGVFHCFTGTSAEAAEVLESGSLVSFTGITTFKNAQNVRDVVASVPLGRFMLETDCPFLAPVPFRGKRCEPAFVRELAQAVAAVKGCSAGELSEATCETAHGFFRGLNG